MLKPFQIRDLRAAQPDEPIDSRSNPSIVQISSTEYDEIASDHPRARLTYVDEDDHERITVSMAFILI